MSTFEEIPPDDPRLTAYALGEMEPAEREEFEKLLKQDAAARAMVAEINGAAHNIGVALASESVTTLAAAPLNQSVAGTTARTQNPREGRLAELLRFPSLYFTISGLAAACFAVGFIIWQANYVRQPKVHYTAVDLTKFAPAEAAKTKDAAESETNLEVGLQPALAGNEVDVVPLENNGNDHAFLATASEPQSTFPIKTGTAAYAKVRHFIEAGRHPPRATVQIEALVNYFPFQYAPPDAKNRAVPFAAYLEVASAPWAPEHRLVRIGLKGRETQKLPGTPAGGALMPIARDVNLLVDFNPAQVQAYRLIGYENRMRRKEESDDDKIDAGEVEAGHTVTALYEVVPVGVKWTPESSGDGLKYQSTASPLATDASAGSQAGALALSDELLTLKLSYQEPAGEVRGKLEFTLRESGHSFDQASADFKFAASVAAFGMILRDSPHKSEATLAQVTKWAQAGLGTDVGGYRTEFIGLVGQAERLAQN